MRAIIAGGSGMIGRHLARALLDDGWDVDILTRDVKRASRRLPTGARAVAWTPEDPAGLETVLDGADGVINLAGVSLGPRPWTPGRKRAILASRLAATERDRRGRPGAPARAPPGGPRQRIGQRRLHGARHPAGRRVDRAEPRLPRRRVSPVGGRRARRPRNSASVSPSSGPRSSWRPTRRSSACWRSRSGSSSAVASAPAASGSAGSTSTTWSRSTGSR